MNFKLVSRSLWSILLLLSVVDAEAGPVAKNSAACDPFSNCPLLKNGQKSGFGQISFQASGPGALLVTANGTAYCAEDPNHPLQGANKYPANVESQIVQKTNVVPPPQERGPSYKLQRGAIGGDAPHAVSFSLESTRGFSVPTAGRYTMTLSVAVEAGEANIDCLFSGGDMTLLFYPK